MNKWKVAILAGLTIILVHSAGMGAEAPQTPIAAPSSADLAKKSQNPISDMVSVPFQYNYYTGGALGRHSMTVVNFQPVIPSRLNKDWNLITRVIVPMSSVPGGGLGTGDSTVSLFFSPRRAGGTTWGIGPIFQLPTASDSSRGTQTFAIGPTAVLVKMHKQWVYGGLIHYLSTVGSSNSGLRTNEIFLQPFVNYNLPHGLALSFAPGITCDFTRPAGDQWTVPFGFGISQILKIGKQSTNVGLAVYYNAVRTVASPEWNFRFQITLLFP